MNRLRIPISARPRKLRSILGVGSGPEGRIEKLRKVVTDLVRHERIEGPYRIVDESRGYAELLIQQACRNGHTHNETMEMADFWLLEKDLVQKLFNVLAPRYKDSTTSYTAQYFLPTKYPINSQQVVLELKGNPWPAIIQDEMDTSKWINNVLLDSVRRNLGSSRVDQAVKNDRHMNELMGGPSAEEAKSDRISSSDQ